MVEIRHENGVVRIVGDMVYADVARMQTGLDAFMQPQSSLTIDFSDVGLCDSAALALVLEWLRRARQRSVLLVMEHLPKQLEELAEAHDLPELSTLPASSVDL